jgi:hypothetical protein
VLLLPSCLQVAANTKGIQLVRELIAEHSLQVVQAYMGFIQANAGVHSLGGWDDNLSDVERVCTCRTSSAGNASLLAACSLHTFLSCGIPLGGR